VGPDAEPPSAAVLRREVEILPEENREALYRELVAVFRAPKIQNPKSTLLALSKASRAQAVLEGVERASQRFAKGDDEGALATLEEAVKSREAKPGLQAQRMFPTTLRNVPPAPRIPTGLRTVDDLIGGLGRKNVGYVIGVTGMGKSAMTVTIGYSAIRRGLKVLHVDTENGEEITQARYLSRFTQVPAALIEDRTMGPTARARVESWLQRNSKRMESLLRAVYLEFLENTIDEVDAAVAEEIDSGFVPDVIIFDSPDHLYMEGGEARWERFAAVAAALKKISQRRNVALWATSQASLAFEGKIAGNASTADSKEKPRVASVVLSVNQLLNPFGKPVGDRKCVHIAKTRSRGGRGATLPLQTKLETMTIRADYEDEDGIVEGDDVDEGAEGGE
jgi:KaiC/GvpD/RAD55 family RecA-like ATPase